MLKGLEKSLGEKDQWTPVMVYSNFLANIQEFLRQREHTGRKLSLIVYLLYETVFLCQALYLTSHTYFNFHHNSKRSTLKEAAKTPNHKQSHFYGIQEEHMSCLVCLPGKGNVCRDAVQKGVCF